VTELLINEYMYFKTSFLTPFSPEDESLCWYEEDKKKKGKKETHTCKEIPASLLRLESRWTQNIRKNQFQQNHTTKQRCI